MPITESYVNGTPSTTLNQAGVTAATTVLTFASLSGFPASPNFRVLVVSTGELMLATAINGLNVTVTRGVEGTTAQAIANGATLQYLLTAAALQQPMTDHTTPATTPNPHPIYPLLSTVTTVGDLLVASANAALSRLGVGTNGQVLTADSTQPLGLKWGASLLSTLTHMGDLIVGGVLGAAQRLAVGSVGSILSVVQNAAAIANPGAAPTLAVNNGAPAGTLVNGTTYDFAYAWSNGTTPDGGTTLASPRASLAAGANGKIDVTAPAAPASGLTLIVYVATSGGTLYQAGTLANASTGTSNTITVSAPPNAANAQPNTTNTTGGTSPAWGNGPLTAAGDLIYGGVAGLLTRLGIGTAGQALFVNAGATAPVWSQLFGQITGVTKGDLVVANDGVGTPVRIAAGPSGQVLTANGAGVLPSWQAATGGGGSGGTGGSIVPIQTQNPSGVGFITFSVPPGFRNVRITGDGRSDAAGANTVALNLTLNGDSGANYDFQVNQSGGAGVASSGSAIQVARLTGATAAASGTGGVEVIIPDHSGSTYFKSVLSHSQVRMGAANIGSDETAGQWRSTAPVTTVTLTLSSGNFLAGSTFTLWGEADTAPVLLTSNSNLIQETILTAGQATIQIPNLPQGYRDLRIEIENARVSDAVASTRMLLQFNGDTASASYQSQELYGLGGAAGATSFTTLAGLTPGNVSGTSIADPAPSGASVLLQDYTGTSRKTLLSLTGGFDSGPNAAVVIKWGRWTSTAAITSIVLAHSGTGTFQPGTIVRVYGEPAAAAGPSVGTGTRARITAAQSIPSGAATAVAWNTNDQDANNQHYTAAAALTGTVAKTAGSATLTGTGTTFTSQLQVGQVISVPGVATEVAVVIAIASDTSLTVATNFANTASGQTASTINSPIVFRQAGMYEVTVGAYMAALASGALTLQLRLNGSTVIAEDARAGINAAAGYTLSAQRPFQQWDYLEVLVTQATGAAVNLNADERTHVEVAARPTIVAAVPYICIEDQKVQNTSGGTATAGAWQTRDLNTIVSDSAGIASLATNQFTLPPGTYRISASAPAVNVSRHQIRLQNITDAATVLTGTSEVASTAASESTRSHLSGRFRITGTKTFAIQHQVQTTAATSGFGYEANFGVEVYTIVELWKEG